MVTHDVSASRARVAGLRALVRVPARRSRYRLVGGGEEPEAQRADYASAAAGEPASSQRDRNAGATISFATIVAAPTTRARSRRVELTKRRGPRVESGSERR